MKKYQNTILWDESKDIETRLNYLVKELTIDEKLHMLTTNCPEIPRLGITQRMYVGGEAAHGVESRNDQASTNFKKPVKTTAFTQPIGLSATFDDDLIWKVGRVVGYEARAIYNMGQGGLSRWAPTVDMERDPRWGRNEEGYGEDPFLTGHMASAYIRGMKGDDPFYILTGSTLKHFYANNTEATRATASSSVDARNKLEYYLEPFKQCIEKGGACGVMTAYNAINGLPCNLNFELQTELRDRYGFDGHVVTDASDFSQTKECHNYSDDLTDVLVASMKAGVDCQTEGDDLIYEVAKKAYDEGKLTIELIDTAIKRSYATRIRLGMFDAFGTTPYAGVKPEVIDCDIHKRLAREVQNKACVLLKNDGFFPVDKNEKIALIGTWADSWENDWYGALPPRKITIYQGLKKRVKNLVCDNGYDKIVIKHKDGYVKLADTYAVITDKADEATVFYMNDWGNGNVHLITEDGYFLRADGGKVFTLKKEAYDWFVRENFDFREIGNGQITINSWNGNRILVKDGALICDGEGPFSFVKRKPIDDSDYKADDCYKFEIEVLSYGADRARELAKDADKVILCLGCHPLVNARECIDRDDLEFIPAQKKLVAACAEVNDNTGMILVSNYPYYLEDELAKIKGLLLTASGNEELGTGVADVVIGAVSPAGRLNQTWYGRETELPDINAYDIRKTKRTYMYFDGEPLFAFGYGLSYTTFRYDKMKFAPENGVPVFTVEVTNTGDVASDEVVQLYVEASGLRVAQPIRKLVGFQRIFFKPGEKKLVKFVVPKEELAYYDVIREEKIVETGIYEFYAGGSSDNLHACTICAINGLEPSERIAYKKITAHRYDEYDNCYLNNTKNAVKYMKSLSGGEFTAEYRDITYEVAPKGIRISYVCLNNDANDADLSFKLYFADKLLVDKVFDKCDDKDKVMTKDFIIDKLDMIGMENINHTVRVKCGEAIGLVSFVFE